MGNKKDNEIDIKGVIKQVSERPLRVRASSGVKEHIISVLVENRFGVLARIAGLFAGRGYNIESLCVGVTSDPSISRMTIVSKGEEHIIEQIIKQLRKIVEVVKVVDITDQSHIERELVLIKVQAVGNSRDEIIRLIEIFRAKILDVTHNSYVIEVTGDENKVEAFLNLLQHFGIKEIVRTGKAAISRGSGTLE